MRNILLNSWVEARGNLRFQNFSLIQDKEETTMTYHLALFRVGAIKQTENNKYWQDMEQPKPLCTVDGNMKSESCSRKQHCALSKI